MTFDYVRSSELLSREHCRMVVIDVQEKLVPHIEGGDRVVANCAKLVAGCHILNVPVAHTEQYPKGLGRTVPQLEELPGEPIEKVKFSGAAALGWPAAGNADEDREQVVLAGMEAHVCVLQTAFDLMALGYRVFLPADAVGSRKTLDWKTALDRLSAGGAVVTTTESVLFEWCETADTPEFKDISRLVKE